MPDRIALKSLTASDLTFFESLFRKLKAGNQKAINLNADVFVDIMYPALPDVAALSGDEINLSLRILGPNGSPTYLLSRKVTKGPAYKNWRLNGEFVRDPEKQPGRFDVLAPGDIAILEFSGDPAPKKIDLLLIAASSPADAHLHAALKPLIPGGKKTMRDISRVQLSNAAAGVPAEHPIWLFAADAEYDAAVEDAALGGIKGTFTLTKKKAAKPISAAALAAAKAAGEKNGRDGEAFAWVHLQTLKAEGIYSAVEWSSKINAVSPFDFRATGVSRKHELWIDAKSTSGEFERVVHMSAAELDFASKCGRYDLWRVYEIGPDGAKLRIAEDIGAFAKAVLASLMPPAGVTIDSVSIDPSALKFGPETVIDRPEDAPGSD